MRPQDHSIRSRAYLFGTLALVAVAVLVYTYAAGRSSLGWWLILAAAVATAFHFYRRSRK